MSDNPESSGPACLINDKPELSTQVVAKLIYICKEDVLKQAMKSLYLEIHESKACAVGNNQMLSSIYIDAPAHGRYSMLHHKRIYGDYKSTEEDALESARLVVLLYLQKIGIIFVDDINQNELTKCEAKLADCQWKLLAASNWANMFQEQTESLKAKLAITCKENEKLIEITKAFHVKKEVEDPRTANIKKEVPTLHVFSVGKEASTPPPFDLDANVRVLQYEKQPTAPGTCVKKSLFKTQPAGNCTTQKCTGVKLLTTLDASDTPLILKDTGKQMYFHDWPHQINLKNHLQEPLIQNGEDKKQANARPDTVLDKDTVVDPESDVKPLPLSDDKMLDTKPSRLLLLTCE